MESDGTIADDAVATLVRELSSADPSKALPALAGFVGTVFGGPIAGGAATGSATLLMSKVIAASATERLRSLDREFDAADLHQVVQWLRALQRTGLLASLIERLKDISDGTTEQFEQTARILRDEFSHARAEQVEAQGALERITALVRSWCGHDNVLGHGTASRPAAFTNPGTLLTASYERVPFLDDVRRCELASLEAWRTDASHASVQLVVGPGGSGKTRLAIEFGKACRRKGWRAGFFSRMRSVQEFRSLLSAQEPTLAIIDYAEARPDLGALLEATAERSSSDAPIRILLLARHATDWWKLLSESSAEVGDLLAVHSPIALAEVPLEGELRLAVYRSAANAFALELGKSAPNTAPDLSHERFKVTLYLELAALAAVEGLSTRPEQLLDTVVMHEMRYWTHRYRDYIGVVHVHDQDALRQSIARLMAAITLLGTVSHAGARALSLTVDGPSDSVYPGALRFLQDLYPPPGAGELPQGFVGEISGVEPDLLGESLVLRVLNAPATPRDYIAKSFEDATAEQIQNGFIVLGRISSATADPTTNAIRQLLGAPSSGELGAIERSLLQRARSAANAALSLAESTRGFDNSLGQVLAQVLKEIWPPTDLSASGCQASVEMLARSLSDVVPRSTTSLRTLAAWAASIIWLSAHDAQARAHGALRAAVRLSDAGDEQTALVAAQEAVDRYRELATVHAERFLPLLATSLNNLGSSLRAVGQGDPALRVTREAVAIRRKLVEHHPEAYRDLAVSLGNLGNVLSDLGDREGAVVAAAEAVEAHRRSAIASPDEVLPELATSLNNLGTARSGLGDREGALQAVQEAVAIRRDLATRRPDAYLFDYAVSLVNQCALLNMIGDHGSALFAARESAAIMRTLSAKLPEVFLPNAAQSLHNLAGTLSKVGEHAAARETIIEAIGIFRSLAGQRTEAYLPNLAVCLNTLGALSERDDPGVAIEAMTEAIQILRHLATARPEAFLPDLAMCLSNLGGKLDPIGDGERALAVLREAVEISRARATTLPDAFEPALAMGLGNLGKTLSMMGQPREGLAATREAAQLNRKLAAAHPAAFLPELARTLSNLSSTLNELGDHAGALDSAHEALVLYRKLVVNPQSPLVPELAMTLMNVGALSVPGKEALGLAAMQEAVDLYRTLVETRGDVFRPDLGRCLHNLCIVRSAVNDSVGALAAVREAVALARRAGRSNSEDHRPDLARSLHNLGLLLSARGDRQGALDAAREATRIRADLAERLPAAHMESLLRSVSSLYQELKWARVPVESDDALMRGVDVLETLGVTRDHLLAMVARQRRLR